MNSMRGYLSCLFWGVFATPLLLCGNPILAKPFANVVAEHGGTTFLQGLQQPLDGPLSTNPLSSVFSGDEPQKPLPGGSDSTTGTLSWLLDAVKVMQSNYFVIWQAKWPSANDWTAAVMGTQVSATLSAISSTLDDILRHSLKNTAAGGCEDPDVKPKDALAYENLINSYFQQTASFWYGEDFFGLRLQAYDDMLWVVLEWLESIKFQDLHSELHYSPDSKTEAATLLQSWHGSQYKIPAAHRSRVFYDLAAKGWDTTLCDGGMIWSPWLVPYKNAITNELFISASIGMYLYFPGDIISDPMSTKARSDDDWVSIPRNPVHLEAAIVAYKWFKNSNMTGRHGLYADGFHINGWSERNPGSRKCDRLNTMLYTYNQGVILSGLRGLWLATGATDFLDDGHRLIERVMRATGWPDIYSSKWQGLGRGGVLEDACDSRGACSQDSQTFKGIFFLHFAEFCRPLRPQESRILDEHVLEEIRKGNPDAERHRKGGFEIHQMRCSLYHAWIKHNAHAAYTTKTEDGKFGMWWGRKYPDSELNPIETSDLPYGAVDYRNMNRTGAYSEILERSGTDERTADNQSDDVRSHTVKREFNQQDTSTQSNSSRIRDVNDRGRGRTVETQAGAMAVFRALYQWETSPSLSSSDLHA